MKRPQRGRAVLRAAVVAMGTAGALLAAGPALAKGTTVSPGTVVHLSGGLDSQPPTCAAGQTRVAHFIINGLDNADQAGLVGVTVTGTFSVGSNSTGTFFTQGNNDAALIDFPVGNNGTVTDAFFTVPAAAKLGSDGKLTYNNFNLSGGECVTGSLDPPPGQTPELGSLALFGSGALGLAGYAWVRRPGLRGRKRQSGSSRSEGGAR